MTVTLGQILMAIYGLVMTGTTVGWKSRRKSVLFWGGLVVPVVGSLVYNGVENSAITSRHRTTTLAEMAPTWQALYLSLEANSDYQVRGALVKAFMAEYPDQKFSAVEYKLFVDLSTTAGLALSGRVSFNPVPIENEQAESAVGAMLAKARGGLDQKITFRTSAGETLTVDVETGHVDDPDALIAAMRAEASNENTVETVENIVALIRIMERDKAELEDQLAARLASK